MIILIFILITLVGVILNFLGIRDKIMHLVKPFSNNQDEIELANFFNRRLSGWSIDWPTPSIERVSCYVLQKASVILVEYKRCGFSAFVGPIRSDFVDDANFYKNIHQKKKKINKNNEL